MVVRKEDRIQVAKLLRAAADGAISEADFWPEMDRLFPSLDDPVVALAHEEAHHYWGNFHQRNIFLVRVKPDPMQVSQGKETFRVLARAIEEGWSLEQAEEALRRI